MGFFINSLPAVLPLIAALIVCVISFIRDLSTSKFTIILAIAVVIFYIIGVIAKNILRKHYDAAMKAYKEKRQAELEAEFEAAKQAREREEMERELARKQKKEQAQEQLLANSQNK